MGESRTAGEARKLFCQVPMTVLSTFSLIRKGRVVTFDLFLLQFRVFCFRKTGNGIRCMLDLHAGILLDQCIKTSLSYDEHSGSELSEIQQEEKCFSILTQYLDVFSSCFTATTKYSLC